MKEETNNLANYFSSKGDNVLQEDVKEICVGSFICVSTDMKQAEKILNENFGEQEVGPTA